MSMPSIAKLRRLLAVSGCEMIKSRSTLNARCDPQISCFLSVQLPVQMNH